MYHMTFSQTLLAKGAYYLWSSVTKASHLNSYQTHKLSHPSENQQELKCIVKKVVKLIHS